MQSVEGASHLYNSQIYYAAARERNGVLGVNSRRAWTAPFGFGNYVRQQIKQHGGATKSCAKNLRKNKRTQPSRTGARSHEHSVAT